MRLIKHLKIALLIPSITFYTSASSATIEQTSRQSDTVDLQKKLQACQKLAEASEQLACFNRIASGNENSGADDHKKTGHHAKPSANPTDKKAQEPKVTDKPTKAKPSAMDKSQTFGLTEAERKRAMEEEEFTLKSEVVSWYQRRQDRKFVVTLKNGQKWQETSGNKADLPKAPFPVEIYEGSFGGYRMKIADNTKVAKVKRVK